MRNIFKRMGASLYQELSDNTMIYLACFAVILGHWAVGLGFMVAAFYDKLNDIKKAIEKVEASEFNNPANIILAVKASPVRSVSTEEHY